ncbi:hypothetical protein, partial [Burkholderia arboris]|uniref:hypothetical protein n=1 Tax=Burkholderia arboris TaxID=488730 RepID=UPI001CF12064
HRSLRRWIASGRSAYDGSKSGHLNLARSGHLNLATTTQTIDNYDYVKSSGQQSRQCRQVE